MKIQLSRKLKQMASALLVVMVLGGILCLSVMYYLSLVQQQNTLSFRSQAWNLAIAVTEAGIEDGLQALNSSAFDGWSSSGTLHWRSNALPDGSWYWVTNDQAVLNAPVISARSYVRLPALAAAPSSTMFAVVNSSTSRGLMVSRAVRVTCAKNPTSLFTASMVSKHVIDLKGNGVLADSFDSSTPAKSTNGKYDASKYTGDFGDVASNDGLIIGVQQANIYGKLHTGAGGSYSIGSQGSVGTHAWQAANGSGSLQPGYFLEDANFTFPDTTLPNTATYLTPQPGDIITTTFPVTTNSVTSTTYPDPAPWGGVTTNIVSYTTTNVCPSPAPPGLTTTTTLVLNSSTQPSPVPAGTTTNTVWTTNGPPLPNTLPPGTTITSKPVTTSVYPSPGYYTGSVTWNYNNGGHFWDWTWNQVVTYQYPSGYTYNYPSNSYSWPNYRYVYFQSTTNLVATTNHFDNVLEANQNYVSSALNGRTIVMGPNVKLVLPNGLSGAENLFYNYTDNINAGLTVYSGGTSASISGNQYINPSGFAGSLIVYCAPTVTGFTLNGNGQFTGVLVAPNADLKMNGGGNSDQDFSGSLMVNNVRLNGHFKFHWDEALGRMNSNNDARFLISSWNEIP